MRANFRLRIFHSLAPLLLGAAPPLAASVIWQQTTAPTWNTGSNWSTGVVPTSTDNVIIPAIGLQPQITAGGSAQFLNINSGASVTVTDLNALTITSTGVSTIGNGGTLTLAGALQPSDLVIQGTGSVTVFGTGTLNMAGPNARIYTNNSLVNLNNQSTIAGQGQIGVGPRLFVANAANGVINANINGGTLVLATDVVNTVIPTNAGTYEASNGGILRISGSVLYSGAGKILADNGTVQLNANLYGGALQAINGGQFTTVGGGASLSGSVALNANVNVAAGDRLALDGQINFGNGASINVANGGHLSAGVFTAGNLDLNGSGVITLNDTSANPAVTGGGPVNNNGVIQGQGTFQGDGFGSVLQIHNNGTFHSNQSGLLKIGAVVSEFTNSGLVQVDAGSALESYVGETQTAGTTQVDGTLTVHFLPLAVQGGALKGTGAINGDVDNSGGVVAPGDSPGTLTINGNYVQGSGGTLAIEIASLSSYDLLSISGTATLGGTLDVLLLGYTGHLGDAFTILTAGGLGGTNFSNFILPTLQNGLTFQESTTGNSVLLTVVAGSTAPTPEPTTFALMSAALVLAAFAKRLRD